MCVFPLLVVAIQTASLSLVLFIVTSTCSCCCAALKAWFRVGKKKKQIVSKRRRVFPAQRWFEIKISAFVHRAAASTARPKLRERDRDFSGGPSLFRGRRAFDWPDRSIDRPIGGRVHNQPKNRKGKMMMATTTSLSCSIAYPFLPSSSSPPPPSLPS